MRRTKIANDFILAAKRHKYVCERLLAQSELTNLPNLKNIIEADTNEWRLLADIYYLTGYIIECSVCAAVYSFYPDITEKRNLSPDLEDKEGKKRPICFAKEKGTTAKLFISNKDHFLENFANFSDAQVFGNIGHDVPLLNGSFQEFKHKKCYDLFNCWNAEIRYVVQRPQHKIDSQKGLVLELSYFKITNFFELATKIYESCFTLVHA